MKKVLITCVFISFGSFFLFAQSYCIPIPDSANLYISNVHIGSINVNSLNEGYSDYSNTDSTVLNYGLNTINITVVGASLSTPDDRFVYIDWNNDFVFDISESFYMASSINVDTSVAPGSYRMRVSVGLHDTHHGAPFPCLTDTGEVEDYTLIINNTTAIEQNKLMKKNILIYPNLSKDLFTIAGIKNLIKIEVYSLSGMLLQTTKSTAVSLNNYAKGIYLFKVYCVDGIEELRVVKD